MRFLVVDDEAKVRSAIVLFLQHQPDVTSIAEADSVEITYQRLAEYTFDIVLLDWEMIRGSGKSILSHLRAMQPGTLIVVLSSRPEARQEALSSGADEFVSKGEPSDSLLLAIWPLHGPVATPESSGQTTGLSLYHNFI